MPIQVAWYNAEHTIIRYEFPEQWSWAELHDAVTTVMNMMRETPHRVDVIFNVMRTNALPNGAISQLRGLSMTSTDNWGVGVMVGGSTFIKTMLHLFIRLNPRFGDRYMMADSDEAAVTLIETHRGRKIGNKSVS